MPQTPLEKLWKAIPNIRPGTKRDAVTPKDPLTRRCICAKRGVIACNGMDNDDPEALVKDILTDLRHLCDRLDLPFSLLNESAYRHYVSERRDQRRKLIPVIH